MSAGVLDYHDGDGLRALVNAYWAGYAAGHRAAEDEIAAAWHEMWLSTRAVLDQPTRVELERRRRPPRTPCRTRCGRCSRCIYVAAYRRRHGEYRGSGA
jgi:hypothetical protein